MAEDVLRQLQILHKFGCHSDIKPENIMRHGTSFTLIDFGAVSTTKKGLGYIRLAWSYTSTQTMYKGCVITPKHDVMELLLTVHCYEIFKYFTRGEISKYSATKLIEYLNKCDYTIGCLGYYKPHGPYRISKSCAAFDYVTNCETIDYEKIIGLLH